MKFSRIVAVLLCVLLLDGCGLIRKTAQPSPAKYPASGTHYDNTDRFKIKQPDNPTPVKIKTDSDSVKPSRDISDGYVPENVREVQRRLVKIAKGKLGCRYQSAGKGPNSFDCSGFTGWVFKQVGISLGASSRDQFLQGRALGKDEELRTGDLVFWNGRRVGSTVGHVGMVVDYDRKTKEFTFIHAAVSTGVEMQRSSAEYYAKRYMGARRILEDPETLKKVKAAEPEEPAAVTPEPEKPAAPAPEPVYHTIKSGDTLSALAVKYHTTVSKICSLNGISSKTILKIGRKLRVK